MGNRNFLEAEQEEKIGVKCPICFTNINDSLLLEQHLALSHAKDVTYKCGICSFVCQYHGDYLNHMKTHFSGPPYKCDYCKFTELPKLPDTYDEFQVISVATKSPS